MAIEQKWAAIPAQLITSNGTVDGHLTIADTTFFKVKQKVLVYSDTITTKLQLEIKRINSATDMELGAPGNINNRSDLSTLLVSEHGTIQTSEQPRPTISWEDIRRAVYDEEPTVALRTSLVDKLGNKYSLDNPFPVRLSDGSVSIGTVNANVEVQLTAKDNDPQSGDIHDSIRIGDGTNELGINSDKSINVHVLDSSVITRTTKNFMDIANAVPGNTLTSIVSYTVPSGKTSILEKISVSGENYAIFNVMLNGSTIDYKRSWYGNFNAIFDFSSTVGYILNSGDTISVKVIHTRPFSGDFNARIQVSESN